MELGTGVDRQKEDKGGKLGRRLCLAANIHKQVYVTD